MSLEQRRAIGRLRPKNGPRGFCTAVRVAPSWILSAAHCDSGGVLDFETSGVEGDAPQHARSIEVLAHPSLDALLVRLDQASTGPFIPLLRDPIDESWLSTPVQLAGYGVREDGTVARELEFLVELIAEVGTDMLVVDGGGRTGACLGDSGGPLLTRDRNGALVVAGVLSQGSAGCVNIDRYVRADRIREWVLAQTGIADPPESDCAEVTSRGFCSRGGAIWCDGETVRAEACGEDRVCGWLAPLGYRCVAPERDPCAGVNDLAACTGSELRSCSGGELLERDCAACGLTCAWDATQGRFDCVE